MTKIEISNKEIYIHGHSGYGTVGNDIACAAISTLSEATCNYLVVTDNKIRYLGSDGVLTIYLDEINDIGNKIIQKFKDMIKDLQDQYPKYIEMREK